MKWSKSPPELIEAFDAVLPGPPVERRLMFGYPAGFLNGNMVCGLFQDGLVLRLGQDQQRKLLLVKGARPFAPMPGRPMRGFVFVPGSLVADEEAITPWLQAALAFVERDASQEEEEGERDPQAGAGEEGARRDQKVESEEKESSETFSPGCTRW